MHLERKIDLSVYYWLVNLFADMPAVHVVDGFPSDNLVLPTVSLESDSLLIRPHELGNRKGLTVRFMYIDVFALNKTQRDEFSYRILDSLQENISIYDYDEGFPPTVVTKIGVLEPDELKMQIIKVMPELVDTLYWRAQINFVALYEEI